jgi:acyl-CoA synthetase (AMP-forming)/AMP-acid ligase II
VADKRLGEVPFAAIEIVPGATAPSDSELKDLVRRELPVYSVPVAFVVVDELPRNPALKVSLPDVASLYERRANR